MQGRGAIALHFPPDSGLNGGVRRLVTCFGGLFLIVLLGIALSLATLPLWLPTAFHRVVPMILERAGVSEADLRLAEFGPDEARIRVATLRYQGLTLRDAELVLSYTLEGLWEGKLKDITVSNPTLEIDVSKGLPLHSGPESEGERKPISDQIPVGALSMIDADVILKGEAWSQNLGVDLELTAEERILVKGALRGTGLHVECEAELNWPDLTGNAIATLNVEEPAKWLELSRERGWIDASLGQGSRSGPLNLEGSVALVRGVPGRWDAEGLMEAVDGRVAKSRLRAEEIKLQARGIGMVLDHFGITVENGTAAHETLSLSASVHASFSGSQRATVHLREGRLSWSDGAGSLDGLEGEIQLASLQPLATADTQELRFGSIQQGNFATQSGTVSFSYAPTGEAENPLELEISADALGGKVRTTSNGRVTAPRSLGLRVHLEKVDLDQVAGLFPQFQGEIEGKASGQLALRVEGQRLLLKPGSLKLVPDTVGRFAYNQRGWLTQEPDLDLEAFVEDRGVVAIMEAPKGASILTELAMSDLEMTDFSLKILEQKPGNERVSARIKGSGLVKGIEVPVVLDVPIRGDVKDAINAVLKLNAGR